MADLSITARLGLDASSFEKSLSGIGAKVAAAFSVAAMAAYTKSIIDFGSGIKDASQRLDVSVESVQELGHAARQSGSDLDAVVKGIEKIARAQEEIRGGGASGQGFAQTFERLGFSLKEVLTLSPEQIFRKMAEAMTDANTAGRMQADLLELLGKGGGQLIPVMKEMTASIQDLRSKGGILTKEEVDLLDTAGDKLDRLVTLSKVAGAKAITNPVQFLDLFNLANTAEIIANKLGYGGKMPALTGPTVTSTQASAMAAENKAATDKRTKAADAELFFLGEDEFYSQFDNVKKPTARAREEKMSIATDSLVSVGNFLGSSGRSTLESAAQKQVQLLMSINSHLGKIASSGGLDSITP